MNSETILVTGGAGYIGTHTVVALMSAGFNVVVIDDLSNSSDEGLQRVEDICGRAPIFTKGDISDGDLLAAIFCEHQIYAVIHFAGLKSVGESVRAPLIYFQNNVAGSLTLLNAMQKANVRRLIFSSSATVYGTPSSVPIGEAAPVGAVSNPYGRTKMMVEQILADVTQSDPAWSVGILRYFNPIGAHESGLIGEDSIGIPNNLLPFVSQVAIGRLSELSVFGNDYPTKDGTGVRDYIHVMDLAEGHVKALSGLRGGTGLRIWNLGTGKGYSVLEIIHAFEKVSGRPISYRFAPRRVGDVAECFADPSKARRELGWQATRELEVMIRDAWRWQINNPRGYTA